MSRTPVRRCHLNNNRLDVSMVINIGDRTAS